MGVLKSEEESKKEMVQELDGLAREHHMKERSV
jgi:hypothetical protein